MISASLTLSQPDFGIELTEFGAKLRTRASSPISTGANVQNFARLRVAGVLNQLTLARLGLADICALS